MKKVISSLLKLSSWASILVATWLLFDLITIIPQHNPGLIPFWIGVMVYFTLLGVLTLMYVAGHLVQQRILLVAIASIAIVAGVYGVVAGALQSSRGAEFEGYIFLMELLLIGHGIVLLLYLRLRHIPVVQNNSI